MHLISFWHSKEIKLHAKESMQIVLRMILKCYEEPKPSELSLICGTVAHLLLTAQSVGDTLCGRHFVWAVLCVGGIWYTIFSLEADTLKKMNYKRGIRKGLETNWFKAADAKYEREIEEKIGIPEKITVQEQLDHYRYAYRNFANIGKCGTTS